MNITLTELIQALAGSPTSGSNPPSVGKYCVIRTRGAGVHAGTVESATPDHVTLKDSRRLWRWHARKGISLSEVARYGIDQSKSRVSCVSPVLVLNASDVYEQLPCSVDAEASIVEASDGPKD